MENSTIPILPNLKKLDKYDSVEFSLIQYDSVNTSIQRMQTKNPNVRFTMKQNKESRKVKVTRTH